MHFSEEQDSDSLEDPLKTRLLQLESHFTWSLREEDFSLHDLVNRLHEQIKLESDEARVTRAYSSLAYVSYLYGDLQAALTNLQKSEALAKKHYGEDSDKVLTVTYGDLAWLYYHMEQFHLAEDYMRVIDRIRVKFSGGSSSVIRSEVLREKGWAFLKFSRKYYSGARECFRQGLETDPNDSDLNAGYAIALYRTARDPPGSRDSPTVTQLRRAIELNPNDAVLLMLLALRLIHPDLSPTSPGSKPQDPLQLMQQSREPIGLVLKALQMSPEHPHVMRYVAQFSRKMGSVDFAISQLEKALVQIPNSAFTHHQLALCYKSKSLVPENVHRPDRDCLNRTIHHLERAVSLKPLFVVAWAELALNYGQIRDFPKAEKHFQRAFRLAKEHKEHLEKVHAKYAQFQLYGRRSEDCAIYHYMESLRLQVDEIEMEKCETKLRQIAHRRLAKDPKDSKACAIEGFIHELRGEKPEAEEWYQRARIRGSGVGENPLLTELRVWLLGFRGAERSARSVLLGRGVREEEPLGSGRPVVLKGEVGKKTVRVVETDLCKAKKSLRREKPLLTPGPHAVILAFLHGGEITEDTRKILEGLEIFGESFWKHVIVLFTQEDTCIQGQEGPLQWLLEKCGHRYYIAGTGTPTAQTIELSDRIRTMISGNNTMHLVIPAVWSQQPSLKMVTEPESSFQEFTPEMTTNMGQSIYRFLCGHAGWFHCTITHLRFRMNGEGEVLYTTVSQDGSCPVSTNHYAAGPLYDIKCVQGGLSQLQLPHCEASPVSDPNGGARGSDDSDDWNHAAEDDCDFLTVAQYTDHSEKVLTPEYITHTHVMVTVRGNSGFRLKDVWNRFKSKIRGQVILMYHPWPKHWLHVFLRPWNVDPKKLCEDGSRRIPGPCDCDLRHAQRYNISCEDREQPLRQQSVQASDGLFLRDKYTDNPTFVIHLEENTMNIKLQIRQDNTDEEVWKYALPPLKDFQKMSTSGNQMTLQTAPVQYPDAPSAGCSVVMKAEHGSTSNCPTLSNNVFQGSVYFAK